MPGESGGRRPRRTRVCAGAGALVISCLGVVQAGPPPRVLVFSAAPLHDYAETAALQLGWDVTVAGGFNFNSLLSQGSWDVVAVDATNGAPHSGAYIDWTPLANAILCDGVRVVVSCAQLDSRYSAGSTLLHALEVVDGGSLAQTQAVYAYDESHPIFTIPNAVTTPMTAWADLWPDQGERFEPINGGVGVAGYSELPAPGTGQYAILVGNNGRTVVNGQILDDLTDAAAAIALWQNELLFVRSAPAPPALGDCGGQVPLEVWRSPGGSPVVTLPNANGPAWFDLNGDGWPELFTCYLVSLWRNEAGTGFTRILDIENTLDPNRRRYSASMCDYDHDGLADIATEPRAAGPGMVDPCARLLHNAGDLEFIDLTGTPTFPAQCGLDSETNCWGDVDGDGDLDLFVPVYPSWYGSVGNKFFRNTGSDTGGTYAFVEGATQAGLFNPLFSTKPEGAQFCDYDLDGDLDLFSNNVIYRNQSTVGVPLFSILSPQAANIVYNGSIDEGAAFFDYDMDGDYDLVTAYIPNLTTPPGCMIWENTGDGTFFEEAGRIESPYLGQELGLSHDDWDLDGDLDLVTRDLYRRNLLMETGVPQFEVQTNEFISGQMTQSVVAWADFDRDGDRDAAVTSSFTVNHVYLNTTYGPDTPAEQKRHVRIRPVRDSAAVPEGLENEFGASVRLELLNAGDGRARLGFTASGSGYINQNEYPVQFALPADPSPGDPASDVRFSVSVTFPTVASQELHRVDGEVNPVLAELDLAQLSQREITVFRSGMVMIDGVAYLPDLGETPQLRTAGALVAPTAITPPPPLTPAAESGTFVGIELSADPAGLPLRVRELVIDGMLSAPAGCGNLPPCNVTVWDVTNGSSPVLVPQGVLGVGPTPRNNRVFVPCNWILLPGRKVRVVAMVDAYRPTSIGGVFEEGPLVVWGGFEGKAGSACDGATFAAAPTTSSELYMTVRFSAVNHDCDGNSIPDEVELATGWDLDCNRNGLMDGCEAPDCPGIVRGDTTCDGIVDGDDIPGFVHLVTKGINTCAVDFNGDGLVNHGDLMAFVGWLLTQ